MGWRNSLWIDQKYVEEKGEGLGCALEKGKMLDVRTFDKSKGREKTEEGEKNMHDF